MKIYGTAKGGALSHKDFGVAFGGGGGGPTTRIAITTDNFSQTGSLSGWAIDDTNEKATATWNRNTTVQTIWMDLADYLGEDIGDTWNLRYHLKLTGDFTATTGVGCYLATGLYNQVPTFSSHNATDLSGSTLIAEAYPAGNNPERMYPFIDGATAYEAGSNKIVPTVSAPTWSSNGAEFYIELIRDGDDITLNMYSDNFETLISNGSGSLSGTYTSDTITHLALLKNYNYSVSFFNGSGTFEVDALYFNNNSTDAGAPF